MKDLNTEIKEAIEKLNNHGVICFPTETVMGLGVLFDDFDAYSKLNVVKRRPEDKPYTLMCGSKEVISKYANIDEKIEKVINQFMPGSITLLLKRKGSVPDFVTHGTEVVGVRIPSNKEALELLKEVGKPLLVPSANRAGEKPAYSDLEAKTIFGDEVDYYISGSSISDLPSTIVDLSNEEPKLIRQGPISFEQIMECYK